MLQKLYLYNNQLQSIPPEIGQLTMLQTLYLYNNQLQLIPPEIGQLICYKHFIWIIINYNQFHQKLDN